MLQVDGTFYLYLAVLILSLPLPWFAAAITAAAFHELCHLTAIHFVQAKLTAIQIKPGGAVIHTQFQTTWHELLCTAAGPAGSLLFLTLCHRFPRLALCAAVQGIFNLFPLYPMDGGRILSCLFRMLAPDRAEILLLQTERILLLLALLLAFPAAEYLSTPVPVFAASLLMLGRKIPCKEKKIRVQ